MVLWTDKENEKRKEEEMGIPMEEDAFGRQEAELKRSLGISFDDEED